MTLRPTQPCTCLRKLGEYIYWDMHYAVWLSSGAAFTNAMIEERTGSFRAAFGNAYLNHFALSVPCNLVYPIAFDQLKKTKHYRLYANLLNIGLVAGFIGWHYVAGTENPVSAMIPNALISQLLVNQHVSTTKADLETRVSV